MSFEKAGQKALVAVLFFFFFFFLVLTSQVSATHRCVTPLDVNIKTRVLGSCPDGNCFLVVTCSSSLSLSLVSSAPARSDISTSSESSSSGAGFRELFRDTALYAEAIMTIISI